MVALEISDILEHVNLQSTFNFYQSVASGIGDLSTPAQVVAVPVASQAVAAAAASSGVALPSLSTLATLASFGMKVFPYAALPLLGLTMYNRLATKQLQQKTLAQLKDHTARLKNLAEACETNRQGIETANGRLEECLVGVEEVNVNVGRNASALSKLDVLARERFESWSGSSLESGQVGMKTRMDALGIDLDAMRRQLTVTSAQTTAMASQLDSVNGLVTSTDVTVNSISNDLKALQDQIQTIANSILLPPASEYQSRPQPINI